MGSETGERMRKAGASFILALVALPLVVVLLFFTFWCSQGPSDTEIQHRMEEHLQEKYPGIDLANAVYTPKSWLGSAKLTGYLPDGDSDYDGYDIRYVEDNGRYSFQDNYYGLLIRTQYEAMIKQVADQYFNDCIVYVSFQDFPDNVNSTTTLQQTMDNGWMAYNSINLYINAAQYRKDKGEKLDKTKFDNDVSAFSQKWKAITDRSLVTGYAVDAKDLAKLKARKEQGDSSIDILHTKVVSFVEWGVGKIPGVE
jgi:hypothetical protein